MDAIFGILLYLFGVGLMLWCFKKTMNMAEERNQNKWVWIFLCLTITPLWACIILSFIKKLPNSEIEQIKLEKEQKAHFK
jgi:hypothetical protein